MKRRDFLKLSAGAVGLGASSLLTNCKRKGGDSSIPLPISAHVAAVRGNNLAHMTMDALMALGGIETIVNQGETVFIKPNMVTLPFAAGGINRFTNGECTKPEIIVAAAEACLQAGAGKIIIGDGSHMPTYDWSYATYIDGSTNLVQEVERLNSAYNAEVSLACLETASPGWVEVPSSTMGSIAVYGLVANADKIISIPVVKTHSWAQLTLSLKNFIGITPLERYAVFLPGGYWDRGQGLDHSSTRTIARVYLDIVAGIQPDLAIIDFSIGVEGDGPSVGQGWGRTVDMRNRLGSWLVLASTDLVASDATAARIMDHNVENISQLTMAHNKGLGTIAEEAIEIIGDTLENLLVNWAPARLRNNSHMHGECLRH
jgi:uncharacterized protein (DUF362 family)